MGLHEPEARLSVYQLSSYRIKHKVKKSVPVLLFHNIQYTCRLPVGNWDLCRPSQVPYYVLFMHVQMNAF